MESDKNFTTVHFAVVFVSALSLILGVAAYLQYQKSVQLTSELQTAEQALNKATGELLTASQEIAQLQTTNRELEKTNQELETTNRGLQTTNRELETTIGNLETTLGELKATVRKIEDATPQSEPSQRELREDVDALKALLMPKPLETVGRLDSPPTTTIGFVNQELRRLGGLHFQKTVLGTIAKMREEIQNLQKELDETKRSNTKWIGNYLSAETKWKKQADVYEKQIQQLQSDLKKQREQNNQ